MRVRKERSSEVPKRRRTLRLARLKLSRYPLRDVATQPFPVSETRWDVKLHPKVDHHSLRLSRQPQQRRVSTVQILLRRSDIVLRLAQHIVNVSRRLPIAHHSSHEFIFFRSCGVGL